MPVTVESLRDHTFDNMPHPAGTTYEVPDDQVENLRNLKMAMPPAEAQAYRDQVRANEEWYRAQAGAPSPK